ncbi:MAG: hypothetical protein HY078_07335 [Elusimicrobia bacterium]|nr:hypothetical protein [Elusimicrobiota bacterium]
MTRRWWLLLVALVILFAPMRVCARPDPLAKEKAQMKAAGYEVERVVSSMFGKVKLIAVLYRETGAAGLHRLKAFSVKGGRPSLIYIEVSPTVRISFDAVHDANTLPALFGEKSPFFAYTKEIPGLNRRSLILLRYDAKADKWRPAPGSPYDSGALQDMDGDGVPELVTRSLPLGNFFTIECRDFQTMTRTAFRTRIHRWAGGRFSESSREFRSFYEDDLRRLKGELDAADPRKTNDYGAALGLGLSIYYDFAELGEPREGWAQFSKAFTPRGQFPPISTCIKKIKSDLRGNLGIPDEWPD